MSGRRRSGRRTLRAVSGALVALLVALALPPNGLGSDAATAPTGSGEPETTGRVVVAYERGAEADALSAAIRAGAAVRSRASAAGFAVVTPKAGDTAAGLARRLGAAKGVRYAQPEYVVRASFTPNDPRFGSQWNLMRVGAPSAWNVERGDPGVTIAVLDSGVDLEHPDLAGRLDTAADRDFVAGDWTADDDFGHGTHVAGVIAASTDNGRDVAGIAHRCRLLPVRVLDGRGVGVDTDVALGIRYAVDQGVSVINLSLGTPAPARVLEDAVEYAVTNDVVVVAAAGNLGTEGLHYPAAYPDVVGVGATEVDDDLSSVSQFGDELDLVAPGVGVLSLRPVTGPSADGPTGRLSGTSVAAPHVAGVAALLRSSQPTWTAAIVADRLMTTAEDLGEGAKDRFFGHGLVRADLALTPGAPPSDDGLPGLPINLSPIAGSVDFAADRNDVYALALSGGQRLRADFAASAGTTMTLSVLGPNAESLTEPPLASVISTGAKTTLDHAVPSGATGTYRLMVSAVAGRGAYSLSWRRCYPTHLTVWAPSTCAWGGQVSVSGRLYSYGQRLDGAKVALDVRSTTSSRWVTGYAYQTTHDDGSYRFTVRPSRRLYYRVRFGGTPTQLPSASPAVLVSPRAVLKLTSPATEVRAGRPFLVSGTLRPERPVKPSPVELEVWLWDAGDHSWIAYRTFGTVSSDKAGYTRFARYVTLPKGLWRIRARAAGNHLYTTTYVNRGVAAR